MRQQVSIFCTLSCVRARYFITSKIKTLRVSKNSLISIFTYYFACVNKCLIFAKFLLFHDAEKFEQGVQIWKTVVHANSPKLHIASIFARVVSGAWITYIRLVLIFRDWNQKQIHYPNIYILYNLLFYLARPKSLLSFKPVIEQTTPCFWVPDFYSYPVVS